MQFTLIYRESQSSLTIGAEPEAGSGAPLLPKATRAEHHTHRNYISMRLNFDGRDVTCPYDIPCSILHVKY